MKKMILIELAWLVGLFVIAYLVCDLILSNTALDVRLHDTYFVSRNKTPFVSASFFAIGFVAYMVRACFLTFKSNRVVIILIVFNCLFLFTFDKLLTDIWYFTMATFKTDNSDNGAVKGLFYGMDPSIRYILNIIPWGRIFLSLILGFNCFMLGKFYTKHSRIDPSSI